MNFGSMCSRLVQYKGLCFPGRCGGCALPCLTFGVERIAELTFSVSPLAQPDEEALICADADCKVRFGLIDRKHHCR